MFVRRVKQKAMSLSAPVWQAVEHRLGKPDDGAVDEAARIGNVRRSPEAAQDGWIVGRLPLQALKRPGGGHDMPKIGRQEVPAGQFSQYVIAASVSDCVGHVLASRA
jgi:hypothetical protein